VVSGFRSRADYPGAAVEPDHHRSPRAVAVGGRPDVEGEAVLALLRNHDAEHGRQRTIRLVGAGAETRGVANAFPRLRALGRTEAQRTRRWLGERDAAIDADSVLQRSAELAVTRVGDRTFRHDRTPWERSKINT